MHIRGLNFNILRRPVKDKSGDSFRLAGFDNRSGIQPVNDDFPVIVRVEYAVRFADIFPASVRYLKFHAGQRLVFRAVDELANDERTERVIIEGQRVRLAGFQNQALRRAVQGVSVHGLSFADNNRRAGFQIVEEHAPVFVRDVLAVPNFPPVAVCADSALSLPVSNLLTVSVVKGVS